MLGVQAWLTKLPFCTENTSLFAKGLAVLPGVDVKIHCEDAIGYLAEATALDPDYTDAWIALATAHSSAFQTGAISSDEYIQGAEPAVRRALQLDPLRAAAHTQQALLQWLVGDLIL